ncbi:MAG: hypothetical protein MUF29_08985, partial [Chitinophagaceae bacterium]|nr:hypothetical protein [Chitinophagaceae bacterium]
PLISLLLFEWYYKAKGRMDITEPLHVQSLPSEPAHPTNHAAARQQNLFGVRVIAASMTAVGFGIMTLGLIAQQSSMVVITVGAVILAAALAIGWLTLKNPAAGIDPKTIKP